MKTLTFMPASQDVILKPNGAGGHDRVLDKSSWSRLRVRKEDLAVCQQALQWACANEVGPASSTSTGLEFRGRFVKSGSPPGGEQELSMENISAICEDYRLLGSHFPNGHSEIFKPELSSQITEAVLRYLIAKVEGEANPELEPWVRRTLELRKSS